MLPGIALHRESIVRGDRPATLHIGHAQRLDAKTLAVEAERDFPGWRDLLVLPADAWS